MSAARAGDYDAAVQHFAAARRDGYNSPALSYNLGVVNYHLRRLDAARQAFAELLEQPGWRALAHYNLGLVAEAAGSSTDARTHFRQARNLTGDAGLRQLAVSRLGNDDEALSELAEAWHGVVSLGTGYDDNVTLAGDRVLDAVSDEGDVFGEVLAAASRRLSGTHDRGWTAGVAGYYRVNVDIGGFDFGSVSGSLLRDATVQGMDWSTGLLAEAQFAGGDGYAKALTYRLRLVGGEGIRWRASNDLSYVFGQSRFDYVSGWRNRTRVQIDHRHGAVSSRIGYELELNERDDLRRDPEFFSYSPTRHSVFGSLELALSPVLALDLDAAYRRSNYQDDNRFLDADDMLRSAARDQDTIVLGLRARYLLSRGWSVWSQLERADGESDIDRYDYTSTRYLVGLERLF